MAQVQLYGTKVKVSFMNVSSLLPSDLMLDADERDLLHLENDDSTISKASYFFQRNNFTQYSCVPYR